jgi:phenylalanyl-tRNA synthetase alpha chain
MRNDLQAMVDEATALSSQAKEERELQELRVKFLGKKGLISELLKGMGKLPADKRKQEAEEVNEAKAAVEGLLARAEKQLKDKLLEAELSAPGLDVTLPGRRTAQGHRHLVSRTLEDIVEIFQRMGFDIAQGPEIELDYYNFESLNFPKDHPARDMQDTFYIDSATLGPSAPPGVLLRTHTSPVQARTMLAQQPPVRVVCPGKVFRKDEDPTHSPMFHQVEGLLVDEHVTFAELKGTLLAFAQAFFGPDVSIRLRPSFFPFTEPSAEIDVTCSSCKGKGCGVCKHTGWLEVLGAGMVHPNVFKQAGYDPTRVTGFAFGLGVERLTMLRYGIKDLGLLFQNDVRFLAQF